MIIRPGTPGDLPAIAALEQRLFAELAWTPAQLDSATHEVWVLEADQSRVVGYVITMLGGDVADLLRIGVHPRQQRQGHAHALLMQAAESLRRQGAVRVLLEVSETNTSAVEFYRAEGFERIDMRRGYYRDGTSAWVMERSLVQTDR